MLTVERYDDLDRMRADALAWLARDEASNTLTLAALTNARRERERAQSNRHEAPPAAIRAALVRRDGAPVAFGVAHRMSLLLSGDDPPALRKIADWGRDDTTLRGVVGRRDAVETCVDALGRRGHAHMRLILFALRRPIDPGRATGAIRRATRTDLDALVAWQTAFDREARLPDRNLDHRALLERRIEDGTCAVWCDPHGAPCSMASCIPVDPSSARIGPVYTPPEHRGRGYAQAIVAALCADAVARGTRVLLLYADADNPTSNAVYARVGFDPIDEHLHFEFT